MADDMGLGKTVQTLALIQKAKEKDSKEPIIDYRDAETDIGQTKQAHITPFLTYI